MTHCPCHSDLDYTICCEPFHKGERHAPTAQDLMRSRYSAYALGLADYLINTTHRDNPQYQKNIKSWRESIETYCKEISLTGLTIVDHVPSGETATVAFEAELSQNDTPFVLKENSYFVKIGSRWLYHSGQTETTRR